MARAKKRMRQMLGLSLILFVLVLLAVPGTEAAVQPRYGGVLRIIDLSEGAQPIGAPWEVSGINTKVMKPVIESLIREDAYGKYHPGSRPDGKSIRPGTALPSPLEKVSSSTTGPTSTPRRSSGASTRASQRNSSKTSGVWT